MYIIDHFTQEKKNRLVWKVLAASGVSEAWSKFDPMLKDALLA